MQGCPYTNGTVSYQWQKSTDGGTWIDIPNATISSYLPLENNARIFYRLRVSSTICNSVAYTNVSVVNNTVCVSKNTTSLVSIDANKPTGGKIKVYPNPAEQGQTIVVSIDGAIAETNYKAILRGVDGRLYSCSVIASTKGQLQVKLPSQIAKGMYFIQVSNNRQQWTEKIMVQ